MECPGNLYRMLSNYCADRYVVLRCPEETVSREITKGCPQGSVCGPVFWDIVMNTLLEALDQSHSVRATVAYADDLAIIVEGKSRSELESRAADIMESLSGWCTVNKMEIATAKTQCALLKGNLARDPTIRLNGEVVRRTKTNKYLGVHLDEGFTFMEHIEATCGRASALMQKLMSIARRQYGIPLSVVGMYMGAVMASITGYRASMRAHRLLLVKPRAAVRGAQRGGPGEWFRGLLDCVV